jgi:hypothetical protein
VGEIRRAEIGMGEVRCGEYDVEELALISRNHDHHHALERTSRGRGRDDI